MTPSFQLERQRHQTWDGSERRYLSEHSMELITGTSKNTKEVAKPELMTA
ncbi:MAG: hypothetical protein QM708_04345 [Propioniciclava sp.]